MVGPVEDHQTTLKILKTLRKYGEQLIQAVNMGHRTSLIPDRYDTYQQKKFETDADFMSPSFTNESILRYDEEFAETIKKHNIIITDKTNAAPKLQVYNIFNENTNYDPKDKKIGKYLNACLIIRSLLCVAACNYMLNNSIDSTDSINSNSYETYDNCNSYNFMNTMNGPICTSYI